MTAGSWSHVAVQSLLLSSHTSLWMAALGIDQVQQSMLQPANV